MICVPILGRVHSTFDETCCPTLYISPVRGAPWRGLCGSFIARGGRSGGRSPIEAVRRRAVSPRGRPRDNW